MDLPPRRNALKEATSSAHAALDALVGGFATVGDYRRYLAGIAAFRLPVEAWLSNNALPPAFADWEPGLVRDELKADLADLETPEPGIARPFAPPEGEGVVGLLYVLEGSTLGARLLAKRAETLGFSADFGARHLFLQAGTFQTGGRSRSVWRTCVTTTTVPRHGGPTPLSTMLAMPSKAS